MLLLIRMTLGAAALFLLPGYALLSLARRQLELDWLDGFCLALGLSLAALPLFLYATTYLGLIEGPGMVTALLALCALVIAWDWWSSQKSSPRALTPASRGDGRWMIYIGFAIVLLFTFVGRFWSVWGLEYPFWTDSYGHGVMAQMIVDQGQIPTTYAPYAQIDDFTYHFGFHTLAAWYHWISGVPLLYGMLILGQILNVLVVPTTYLFAHRLFRSRVVGLAAAVVAGLLSHMPSQFVNWGRFTQLDGQMLLPIVLVLYLALIETRTSRYRLLLLTMLSFAGLFFVHYRIFIFAIFLAAILWGWAMWRPALGQSRWRLLGESSLLAGGWVILLFPWLWRLAMGFGGTTATVYASGFDKSLYGNYFGFAPHELLDFGMYGYLWALAGLGAIWGLWKRNARAIAVLLWAISIFAAANLNLINFTPLYSNLIVIIAIYLPLAVLCGYLIGEVVKWIGRRVDLTNDIQKGRYPLVTAGLLVALVGIGVGSVQRDMRLVAPENIFLRTEDLAAIDWIQQEIPQNALFYVATSFWMPIVAHGLDAGYFLPLVAGRQTIIPLQNYSSDGTLEYRNFINQRLLDLGAATDAQTLWQTMRAYDITHIYIGKRPTDLSPQFFLDDPAHFELLYDKDGVWIFAVRTTEEL